MAPDGLLTTEFTLIEHYARLGAEGRTNDDYWCDAMSRPELQCLDIAAPSTLGGSLNVSQVVDGGLLGNNMLIYEVQTTANATSTDLFGQYDLCHGRLVGDGVIDVFDMATLLSYIFGDWMYGDLSEDPYTVVTTQGRRVTSSLCGDGLTRQDYYNQYALDTCVYTDGDVDGEGDVGRRLSAPRVTARRPTRSVGVYIRSCGTYERCIVVDRPLYMLFISILDSSFVGTVNVTGIQDALVHHHASGLVVSRGTYGGGTFAPINGGVRRILVSQNARLGRVQAYASMAEEVSVISRPSFPVLWSDYVPSPTPMSIEPRNGRWTTFDMRVPLARLHAVFTQRFDAHLSSKPFVASDRPGWNEVRVTRHCAPGRCDLCASIESGLNAVHHGTLEVFQIPIHSSCAYSLHVYASETVTLQYAIATTNRDFHHPAWSSITCFVRRSSDTSPLPLPLSPPPRPPPHDPPPSQTGPSLPVKSRMSIWISLALLLWSALLCVFNVRLQRSMDR